MPVRAKARFYAPVTFRQKLEAPLLKASLRYDPIFYGLEVIHRPHNTNFRVSEGQWHRVITLIEGE